MNFVNELSLGEIETVFREIRVIVFKCRPVDHFVPFYISRNASKIVGFDHHHFQEQGQKWIDRIHPDDRKSFTEAWQDIFKNDYRDCLYRFRKNDGAYIWFWQKIKLFRDDEGKPDHILSIVQDVSGFKPGMIEEFPAGQLKMPDWSNGNNKSHSESEQDEDLISVKLQEWIVDRSIELGDKIDHQKKIENKLRKRLLFEYALTQSAILLMSNPDDESFEETLNILMEVTDSDRAYISKNYIGQSGFPHARRIHEVCREDAESLINHPDYQDVMYEDIPWLYENLSNDKLLIGSSEEIPSPEWELFKEQGIRSIAVLPLYTDDEWFGYVGFDYLSHEKEWDEDEVNLLRSTANLLGAAKKRQENSTAPEKTEKKATAIDSTLLDQFPGLFLVVDEQTRIREFNSELEDITGYPVNELKNRLFTELVEPDERDDLKKFVAAVLQSGSQKTELKLLTDTGETVPLYIHGKTRLIDDKQHVLINAFDISDTDIYEEEEEASTENHKTSAGETGKAAQNSIDILTDLFDSQRATVGNTEIRDLFSKSQLRFYTISLLEKAIRESGSKKIIPMKPLLSELSKKISSTFGSEEKDIDFQQSIDDFSLPFDKALPFALLVNEIVTNSYEHAFKGQSEGQVKIEVQTGDGKVWARLADNGSGIDSKQDLKQSNTLGIKLIGMYIKQLDAKWKANVTDGTSYEIIFEKD